MDLRFKWKNVRDAFVRYRRQLINCKKRNCGKHVKTYIYAKQMHFLTKNIDRKLSSSSSLRGSNKKLSDNCNHSPAFEQVFMPGNPSPSPCTNVDVMEVEEKEVEEVPPAAVKVDSSHLQQIPNDTEQSESDEYYDMAFFKSLQPMLRRLTPEQKMLFRIDVMKLLANYTGAGAVPVSFSSSGGQEASYSQSVSITDVKCAFGQDVFPSSSDDL